MAGNTSLGQSLGQALGQFAFGGDNRKSQMKGMLDGAHAGAYDASAKQSLAQALKAQAEATQLQAENDSRTPARILSNAMTGYGIPQDDVQAVNGFLNTGTLGGKYSPPLDGRGPIAPAPQPSWAGKLPDLVRSIQGVNTALTIGDKNSENIAKASAINRGARLSDEIMAGLRNRNTVGGAEAAVSGKPLYHADTSGAVLDQYSGQLDTNNPMAGASINLKKEQAGAQKANAAQSYASAGSSNATAAKTRQEINHASEDAKSSGAVLGAPVPAVSPWANQSNSKDANKVKASELARSSKELEKDADAVLAAKEAARDAARFIELNARVPTGGVSDKTGVGRWTQSFGADYSGMQAISAKLTPAMRTPGSGTTSDADLALFKQATVGVDKPRKTNDNIANAYIARADQMEQYADFRQTYLEQNGTLAGAERHWKDYLNKNPIFDEKKKASFELNQDRRPWREHFKGGGAPATAKPAATNAAGVEAEMRRRGLLK